MTNKIIGRKEELELLKSYLDSDKSEFVAIYGRRRVGKTFLVRMVAEDKFDFYVTGMYGAKKSDQLINFAIAFQKYSKSDKLFVKNNWILAFYELSQYLESLPEGKKIIFIDELPWMDTPKSGFVSALENFWNSWASQRSDVKLIVCGSATSWMINNLIKTKGGLHNRLTHKLLVEPFTLLECEMYYKEYGFCFSRRHIAEAYMVMGGIPYYMSLMDKSKSLAQNIDQLFFDTDASLKNEFNDLYKALFKNATPHISVVTALASKGKGLTRQELLKITSLTDNGAFSLVMEELEQCGFIRLYEPFSSSKKLRDGRENRKTLYQLVDFYTLFYFQFIKNNRYHDENFWSNSINSPLYNTWCGLSFERLCLCHLPQIKKALGISGVQTIACSWISSGNSRGAQIDLMIDRKDETVNVCEIKYSKDEYEITKTYEEALQNKINVFQTETKSKKTLILTMITSHGLKDNMHSSIVQKSLTLEDLIT